MRALATQWGPAWNQVFGEIAGSGFMPGTTLVIGTMNQPEQVQAAEALAQANRMGTAALERALPPEAKATVSAAVDLAIAPFATALIAVAGPAGVPVVNALRHSSHQLALAYAQSDSADEAPRRAAEHVLGAQYAPQMPAERIARFFGSGVYSPTTLNGKRDRGTSPGNGAANDQTPPGGGDTSGNKPSGMALPPTIDLSRIVAAYRKMQADGADEGELEEYLLGEGVTLFDILAHDPADPAKVEESIAPKPDLATTKRILREAVRMRDAGATEAEVAAYLKGFGLRLSENVDDDILAWQEYEALPEWLKPVVATHDLGILWADGMTLGHLNKAVAWARSLSTGKSYQWELEQLRAGTEDARARAGWAGTVAEFAGGAKLVTFLADRGITLAGRFGTEALTGVKGLAARAGLLGAEGAAYGGLYAEGHDEDIPTGAAIGAGFGLLGSLAYDGARAAAPYARDLFRQRTAAVWRYLEGAAVQAKALEDDAAQAFAKRQLLEEWPDMPQRPVEADYKHGPAPFDAATGKLLTDPYGNPLSANVIVGRQTAEGGDVAPTMEEIERLVNELTARGIERVPPGTGDQFHLNELQMGKTKYLLDWPLVVYINDRIVKPLVDRVIKHEAGHVFDQIAGKIAISKTMLPELQLIYSLGRGHSRPERLITPKATGYKAGQERAEYIAEAIRAYFSNPNTFKALAPNSARAIQKAFNKDPFLKYYLQFNSLAAAAISPAVAGLAGRAAPKAGESHAAESARGRDEL